MTSAAAARSCASPADLLGDSYEFVDALGLDRAGQRWQRRRSAARFMERHPHLSVWMARPTRSRLADLHRLKAWPFLTWLFVDGHLRPDLELMLAKPGGVELGLWWSLAHLDEVERAQRAAMRLGWSANWTRQVLRHATPVLCLWLGKTLCVTATTSTPQPTWSASCSVDTSD